MCRVDAGIGAEAIVVILGRRALTFLLLSAIHPASNPSARARLVRFAAIGLPSLTMHTGAAAVRLEEEEVEEQKKQVVRI